MRLACLLVIALTTTIARSEDVDPAVLDALAKFRLGCWIEEKHLLLFAIDVEDFRCFVRADSVPLTEVEIDAYPKGALGKRCFGALRRGRALVKRLGLAPSVAGAAGLLELHHHFRVVVLVGFGRS